MSQWIDRRIQEPSTDDCIQVWSEEYWVGNVICMFDYGTWCDVIDKVTIEFVYWCHALESPYCEYTALQDYDLFEDHTDCGQIYVPGGINWTSHCPGCGRPIKRKEES